MNAVQKLLDKARAKCSSPTYKALAEKLDVTPQTVSQWKAGAVPISDERIAQIARIAGEDGGEWLLTIHSQDNGAAGRAWRGLQQRLGLAAMHIM